MMFEGVRPFDWVMLVVEILVLLLIAWEIGREEYFRRNDRNRKAALKKIADGISGFIERGQKLVIEVPECRDDFSPCHAWMGRVAQWSYETIQFLSTHSPAASAAFLLVGDSQSLDNVVRKRDGSSFRVAGNLREWYQELSVRLSNLHGIKEKADVYF